MGRLHVAGPGRGSRSKTDVRFKPGLHFLASCGRRHLHVMWVGGRAGGVGGGGYIDQRSALNSRSCLPDLPAPKRSIRPPFRTALTGGMHGNSRLIPALELL